MYPTFSLERDLVEDLAPSASSPPSEIRPYLRGPISWAWLQEAVTLGHGALATGLAIWHLRALNKSLTFKASLRQLRKWSGISEKMTRIGLHKLEGAGLVRVVRVPGQSPTITLVE